LPYSPRTRRRRVEHLGKSKAGAWAEVERQGLRTKINNQTVTGRRLTFAELADRYEQSQIPNLAATTQYLHRHVINDYLLPRWGMRPALNIVAVEIQEWVKFDPRFGPALRRRAGCKNRRATGMSRAELPVARPSPIV
jgi:hypothetical protein